MQRRYLVPIRLTELRTAVVLADSPREAIERAVRGEWDEVYDPQRFWVRRARGRVEEER